MCWCGGTGRRCSRSSEDTAGWSYMPDDFVVTFQYKDGAERFYEHLKKNGILRNDPGRKQDQADRLAGMRKKMCQKGRKPQTFTFHQGLHYCSHGRNGKFRVKRKPAGKNLQRNAKRFTRLSEMRTWQLAVIMKKMNPDAYLVIKYCSITDNR